MSLTPPEIAALSRLLDEALELPSTEREAWLASLPAAHLPLAPRLRDMLAESSRSAGKLDSLPSLGSPDLDDAVAREDERVGPYRLLREIGRGGMGSVWLAERADGSFERQVALKLPRLAWGAGLAERMARERAIVARLEHPSIARLYDAGVDERGRPYLALELIDGQPIDSWCEARSLGVRERLRLFVQVVRAVAYAHGKLVVHRDLKPSNVLVTADGRAQLLDFGIAKLLQSAQTDQAALTQDLGRVLTPHYASPEQIRGEPVTVASDVYSLGVLLYELLCGQLPFTPERPGLGALEQAILESEPTPASARTSNKATARRLKGEVDAILAKALQREPAQRYATADALADDIERHLAGEPVKARPDSAIYRLRKAARRHWISLGAAVAVLVAVLGGAGAAVVQAQRAAQAAQRERDVKAFVSEVLRAPVKQTAGPGQPQVAPAEAFLEHSAGLVQARFADQPEVQAELYAVIGKAFSEMGARRLASEYARLRVASLEAAKADRLELARAQVEWARAMLGERGLGDRGDIESTARRAVELAAGDEEVLDDAEVALVQAMRRAGKYEEAKRMRERIEARIGDKQSVAAARLAILRSFDLMAGNRRDEAIELIDSAIDMIVRIEGPDSVVAASMRISAANALAPTTHAGRAQQYFDLAMRTLEEKGPRRRAWASYEKARFAATRHLSYNQITAKEALSIIARTRAELADTNEIIPEDMVAELDLDEASVLHHWGNVRDALTLAERGIVRLRKSASNDAQLKWYARSYGSILMSAGQHEEADRWLRERLKEVTEAGGDRHPYDAWAYIKVAHNLAMAKRLDEATAVLDSAPRFPRIVGEGAVNTNRYNLMIQLARSAVLGERGEYEQAMALFPHELIEEPGPMESPDSIGARATLGAMLCLSGRSKAGLPKLEAALTRSLAMSGSLFEHNPGMASMRAMTGLCALRAGNRARAMELAAAARAAFDAQPQVSPSFKEPLQMLEREFRLGRARAQQRRP